MTPSPVLAGELPEEAQRRLATATRRHTRHAGGRLVWHAWGRGEPVVLLHGGSGSWTHWLRNIDSLVAAGRQVLAADMPGCGDSDKPDRGEDADALVTPLAEGLQQLLDGQAFDLVGFSFGGLTAGLLAAQHPPGLRRLVIVGAPALALEARPVRLLEWRHLVTEEEQAQVHRANLASLMFHAPEAITPLAVALHAANLRRDRLRRRRLAQTDALQQALMQLRVPLHAIYGREDALYRTRPHALEAALRAQPGLQSLTFIEGAGHWVQFESSDAFDTALRRVLTD